MRRRFVLVISVAFSGGRNVVGWSGGDPGARGAVLVSCPRSNTWVGAGAPPLAAYYRAGVPVAFGVLTTDTVEQAQKRVDRGAEAVRTALEMADLFANLRAAAAR